MRKCWEPFFIYNCWGRGALPSCSGSVLPANQPSPTLGAFPLPLNFGSLVVPCSLLSCGFFPWVFSTYFVSSHWTTLSYILKTENPFDPTITIAFAWMEFLCHLIPLAPGQSVDGTLESGARRGVSRGLVMLSSVSQQAENPQEVPWTWIIRFRIGCSKTYDCATFTKVRGTLGLVFFTIWILWSFYSAVVGTYFHLGNVLWYVYQN